MWPVLNFHWTVMDWHQAFVATDSTILHACRVRPPAVWNHFPLSVTDATFTQLLGEEERDPLLMTPSPCPWWSPPFLFGFVATLLPQTTERISSQLFPPIAFTMAANHLSLFLSNTPIDTQLALAFERCQKGRGCWGLHWCLWDARYLSRWKTCAPTLMSSLFSFHPAVWPWGPPPLLGESVWGRPCSSNCRPRDWKWPGYVQVGQTIGSRWSGKH